MNLTGGIILFATIWFLTFYIVLQLGMRTQQDEGKIVPGTPAGAPAQENVGQRARVATLWAVVIWAIVAGIIWSGWITVDNMDIFGIINKK